jgi:hypothetical protein
MKSAIFRVKLFHELNGLDATVEVISVTSSAAKRFVKQVFFPQNGWKVIDTQKVREL